MTTPTAAQINAAIDRIGGAFTDFKANVERRLDEQQDRIESTEAKNSLLPLSGGAGDIANLHGKNLGPAEVKAVTTVQTQLGGRLSNLAVEEVAAFNQVLKSRFGDAERAQLQKIQAARIEKKEINLQSAAAGEAGVPQEISRIIEKLELKFSPVRRLVNVQQIGSGDYKELVSLRGASSGWVGETGSRVATDTPLLREVVPTMGEIYSYPVITEWALDDIFFDAVSWLTDEVAQEFAFQEGAAVISGNGSSKPTGMTNTTPVLTADFASPLRAAAAYQYVVIDKDSDDSPAPVGMGVNGLIDLVYSLNATYRANATFVANSLTLAAIRKLRDANGGLIWGSNMAAGQPNTLLGYPVETWEQMPDVADGAFPIAFGDFKRGYTLVDRVGLRITIDNNITTPGKVKYFIRRREGGIPRNNDAIKFGRTIG